MTASASLDQYHQFRLTRRGWWLPENHFHLLLKIITHEMKQQRQECNEYSQVYWITCQIAEKEEKVIFNKQITHLSTHSVRVAV